MTGSVSNPPRDRGVIIRRRPVPRSASKTGRDRRRSRSASWLYSRMIAAISRAASISEVSGSQMHFACSLRRDESGHHAHLPFAGAMFWLTWKRLSGS